MLNIELPYDPIITLPCIYQKDLKAGIQPDTFTPMYHSSIIHNNEKAETIQMSINRWMDKQNVLQVSNGLLYSHKKK